MSVKLDSSPKIKLKVKTDLRPSDFEYALISNHVYDSGLSKPVEGSTFHTYRKWNVIYTRSTSFGYFGAVYQCNKTKQIVIAHRGTNNFIDIYEDIRGIFLNKCSRQKEEAFLLVSFIIHQIRTYKQDYQLSFTGHSLGAFLAEISVYFAQAVLNFSEVSAVTFESPGSKQSMQCLKKEPEVYQPRSLITCEAIKRLDITTYVCYPNMINACNEHVGTVYAINVDINGSFPSLYGLRLLNSHSMDGIVDWFKKASVEKNSNCQRLYMSAWPRGYKQVCIFFKYANFENGVYTVDSDLIQYNIPAPPVSSIRGKKSFEAEDSPCPAPKNSRMFERWIDRQKKKIKLAFYGNFRVMDILKYTDSLNVMPLNHFSRPLQQFLKDFYEQMQLLLKNNGKDKVEKYYKDIWNSLGMPGSLVEDLLHFQIRVNKMDIEEISLIATNVFEFRKDLSSWLETTGFAVEDLVNGFDKFEETVVLRFKNHYDMPPRPSSAAT